MKGLKQITGEAFLPIIAGNFNFVVSKSTVENHVIFCTYSCTEQVRKLITVSLILNKFSSASRVPLVQAII